MKGASNVDFDEEDISLSDRQSVERTFLSKYRTMLSEERTILAYIGTELTFIGIIVVILKFYFEEHPWSVFVAFGFIVFFGLIILFELSIIQRLRLRRRKLQKKDKHLLD